MPTTLAVFENPANNFTELQPGITITDLNGVMHPWQIIDLWSDTDLAAINIYRVTPATVPAGQQVTSYTYQRVNGVVTQVLTFVVLPRIATPRQIRLAMNQQGVRDTIEAWVKTQSQDIQDNWDYASEFVENNPLVIACMTAIGKTQADVTYLFDLAVTL
jgi:hypothetical protein